MRTWLGRLHPITSLHYVLLDLALGFGVVDVLLYVLAPPSPATRAVLGDTLYFVIGPPTWGIVLLVACCYAFIVSGFRREVMQTGFAVLIPAIGAWIAALVISVIASGAPWADTSKIIALSILMAMLVSNALRWMVAHNRAGTC